MNNQLLEPIRIETNLHKPCGDCPFTKNGPATHFGVISSLYQYLKLAEAGLLVHTCHKTDNRPACDGPRNYKGENPQHCAGLLQMQASGALPKSASMLRRSVDWDSILRATDKKVAFESVRELVTHYTPAIWAWVLMVFDNPKVIRESDAWMGEPPLVRLNSCQPGEQLVPCSKCGQPASRLDPHHPYCAGCELCEICYYGSRAAEELIELVETYSPELIERVPRLP